jgi:hypothetical protein
MGIQQYKTLILVVTVVVALIAASPAIQQVTLFPQKDPLTEFFVLGPFHNATYPFNITASQNYHLFFDVDNHLGAITYYQIQVKFRNELESAPDSFNHTNSDQPSLGAISLFAANNETVELPVDVSFQYNIDASNSGQVDVQSVTVNGATLSTNGEFVPYDSARGGFFGNIVFELWIYNGTANDFQYNQRYVSLWLQMNP